jgi:hypothetical protein
VTFTSIGALLFFAGLCCAAVGGLWAIIDATSRGRRRQVAAAPRLTCADAAARPEGTHVVVHGTTAPGLAGAAVSPGWGLACAWWRCSVSQLVADGEGHTRHRNIGVRELPSFAVIDDTGSLQVDSGVAMAKAPLNGLLDEAVNRGSVRYPRQGGPVLDHLVATGFVAVPHRSRVRGYTVDEATLPAGVPVTVVAEVSHTPEGPRLVRRGRPAYAVRQSLAAFDEAIQHGGGGAGRTPVWLALGGVAATVLGMCTMVATV